MKIKTAIIISRKACFVGSDMKFYPFCFRENMRCACAIVDNRNINFSFCQVILESLDESTYCQTAITAPNITNILAII